MIINRILGIWQMLLIGSIVIFMNFYQFKIERKRTSGKRTYLGTLIAKYFTYIIFVAVFFVTDYCGGFNIPQQVNHDFYTQTGSVLNGKIIDTSEKVVEYENLNIKTEKGIEKIELVIAPRLEKDDYIKVYYDDRCSFVSEVNEKDVTGIYRWKPSLLGDSTVNARIFLSGYLIVFFSLARSYILEKSEGLSRIPE